MKKIKLLNVVLTILILSIISGANISGQSKKAVTDSKEKVLNAGRFSEMKDVSSFKALNWQYLGPTNISGRCTDVEGISPRGGQYTIWVGSATGGVWKSVNEGTTFEPVFDDMPTASVGDIAIDPVNPDVVWVGTGEANIFRSSNPGCGIYKTTDGGKSWKNMGLENTHTIGRVRINPSNTNIVYVAATGHEWTPNEDRGVFKTTDGGLTWTKVLYIDQNSGAYDIVLDPRNPDVVYCTTWERIRLKWNDPRTYETTKNNGIWKSTDGGKSWKKINDGLPEANKRGRIGIDIAASQPDVLYAYLDNYEIAYRAAPGDLDSYRRQKQDVIKGATIYRTNNGGTNWEQVSGLTPEMKSFMERHSATYGWVFGQIRVDPNDVNTIYTMGIWLNKSTDGGKTFTAIREPHADHHGLWIDPANSSYLLNVQDGGLGISYDGGASWKFPIEELPLAQFYNIAYDFSTPFRVVGSIQDHHSFYAAVDLSRGRNAVRPVPFTNTLGAEGSSHAIDPRDNNTIYSSTFYGLLARAEMNNYPASRKDLLPAVYPDQPVHRGQWVAPTILSPHNNDIVYHGMQYVMKSKDKGNTWTIISPDLSFNNPAKSGDINYQTISALDESPIKEGLLYAGTDDGRLWVTKNGGGTWSEIKNNLIPVKWVSRLVASAYDMGTVYMAQTGRRDDDFQIYLWRSDDFGSTWKDISGNLPLGAVNVIREDPVKKGILYVGTDGGVFVSTDAGSTWQALGGNLPFTYVHDLQVHPRDNMIIIATHGRGMWLLDANPVNGKDKIRQPVWR